MPNLSESIRLAPLAQPGANLYNAYHLLTQVSGLYAQAAQYEPDGAAGGVWRELCDSALKDLGDLFNAWESALGDSKTGKPPTIDQATGEAVARACRRIGALSAALNVWTPMARWARIMLLLERRWQRFLGKFFAAGPNVKERLAGVRAGSLARAKQLTALTAQYSRDSQHAALCFKLVEG